MRQRALYCYGSDLYAKAGVDAPVIQDWGAGAMLEQASIMLSY